MYIQPKMKKTHLKKLDGSLFMFNKFILLRQNCLPCKYLSQLNVE